MSEHESIQHPAEAWAMASVEGAEAKAAQLAAKADASAAALLEAHYHRTQKIAKDYIDKHLPDTELFREVVSIRAYYKAEQRGFKPGQQNRDWIEAEQEILNIPVFEEP